jgi:Helicase associated domain
LWRRTCFRLTNYAFQKLFAVEFEFIIQSQWEVRFAELLAYKKIHGHFHVTSKENATLSSWSKTQRQRFKNTMALYQGMYGVEYTSTQQKAKELYENAKKRAEEAKVAGEEMPTLGDVGEAKNTLDPEKIAKLTAVGFEWELQKDSYVESWENRYLQLMKFKVVHGHCRVPKSSGENPQLGQWVKQVRSAFLSFI